MSKAVFTPQIVHHIAQLANLSVTPTEEETLSKAFAETIDVVAKMADLDTTKIEPTHQVTGLENVLREDEVISEQMFTQDEALANAARSHAGFFVVPQVIDQKDA